MKRWIAAVLWIGLVIVMAIAPPQPPDVLGWVLDLMLGRWEGTEPWVVVHFMLMGIWPMLLSVQLRDRMGSRPLPAWPFAMGSFALGGYALLPWFVLTPASSQARHWAFLEKLRVPIGAVSLLSALGFGVWAGATGSVLDWWAMASSDGFVFAMSFDFLALWLTSILLARERGGMWRLCLLPVLGTAVYSMRAQGPVLASLSPSGSSSASK
jgi:hypothetical protein